MHRKPLLSLLEEYSSRHPEEIETVEKMTGFVQRNPNCFERSLLEGHITASAWLLNLKGDCVLLTHHAKLNAWLQVGGHADGCSEAGQVALKEAQEESGITGIKLCGGGQVFDIDIHPIPAKGEVPEHLHYDIRFVCRVTSTDLFTKSAESIELAWVKIERLEEYHVDESILRMKKKYMSSAGEVFWLD